jgi:hypothetical protein
VFDRRPIFFDAIGVLEWVPVWCFMAIPRLAKSGNIVAGLIAGVCIAVWAKPGRAALRNGVFWLPTAAAIKGRLMPAGTRAATV